MELFLALGSTRAYKVVEFGSYAHTERAVLVDLLISGLRFF